MQLFFANCVVITFCNEKVVPSSSSRISILTSWHYHISYKKIGLWTSGEAKRDRLSRKLSLLQSFAFFANAVLGGARGGLVWEEKKCKNESFPNYVWYKIRQVGIAHLNVVEQFWPLIGFSEFICLFNFEVISIMHTGAKILNLFKNSHFENLTFHKIHIFKISQNS